MAAGYETDPEPLYRAPRNSVWEPPGWKSGHYGGRKLVLARLELVEGVAVVPAHLLWVDGEFVHVEWERGGALRSSWLRKRDVCRWLRI